MKKSLIFIFVSIALLISFYPPLKEKASVFFMLETISFIDNLMTPSKSPLLAELSKLEGVNQISEAVAEEDVKELEKDELQTGLKSAELDEWIKVSQTKALIVQHKGKVVHESYSNNNEKGIQVNGLSMTKTITALLIGIAIDEGLIASELDSILIYLPEIILAEGDEVAIRDLLRQESGMRDDLNDVLTTLKGESMEASLERVEFGDDKKFSYSNVNYHLLTLILKRVYQQEFSEIISQKLWRPLGLKDAKIIETTGYCCIYAEARTWLGIAELFLNDGVYQDKQIISSEWIDKMKNDSVEPDFFIVQLTSKAFENLYGYHVFSGMKTYPNLYWSEGMGLQLMMVFPETDTIVVRLGDIPSAFKSETSRWEDGLAHGLFSVLEKEGLIKATNQ